MEISQVLTPQKKTFAHRENQHTAPQLANLNSQDIPPTAKTVFQKYPQLTVLRLILSAIYISDNKYS